MPTAAAARPVSGITHAEQQQQQCGHKEGCAGSASAAASARWATSKRGEGPNHQPAWRLGAEIPNLSRVARPYELEARLLFNAATLPPPRAFQRRVDRLLSPRRGWSAELSDLPGLLPRASSRHAWRVSSHPRSWIFLARRTQKAEKIAAPRSVRARAGERRSRARLSGPRGQKENGHAEQSHITYVFRHLQRVPHASVRACYAPCVCTLFYTVILRRASYTGEARAQSASNL